MDYDNNISLVLWIQSVNLNGTRIRIEFEIRIDEWNLEYELVD